MLLLDLFLLSKTIANHVLRSRVQRTALDVMCRKSSLGELRLLLLLSRDLGYIPEVVYSEASKLAEEVSKMLYAWIKSQKTNSAT